MAFTDTLRGDGLVRAQRALAGLQGDPLRLDRARQRFSHSPPPYTSDPSGTTTRSASPITPSEERRRDRRFQLGLERMASKPYHQFEHQVSDEEKRIWNADLNGTYRIPVGSDAYTIASETVKKGWIEQGIWNNKWNKFASGRWKHEEPLELESESEMDSEAGPSPPLFSLSPKPQPKPRRAKSDDEKRRIAERRVIREREREASRPYHQFVYQISKERERIQDESANGEGASAANINTRAYENVKNTWTKRGIWNKRWGILPGMSWKHEEPLEDEAADGSIPVSETALRNAQPPVSHEARQVPFAPLFGPPPLVEPDHPQGPRDEEPLEEVAAADTIPASQTLLRNAQPPVNHEAGDTPFTPLFGPLPPIESNHRQASDVMNTSQQGPSADVDSTGLENDSAECSPTASKPSHARTGKRVRRATTGQALRPSRRPSQKDGQPASASLGPVHPSKVSKAVGKRKGPQRRLNISQKVSSDGLPLSSGMDAAEPQPSPSPERVAPRRSKRIQPPVPSVSKDPTRTASTNPSKRAVRSKPERNAASSLTARSSAKPQGISKKQPAKITRGRARGKKVEGAPPSG